MAKIEDLIRQISVDKRDRQTRKVRWEQFGEDCITRSNSSDVVRPFERSGS
jgi:hypothetical protein